MPELFSYRKSFTSIVNLKYSTPRDRIVCATCDYGNTFNYFSANEYGSVSKAKEAAHTWLSENENQYGKEPNIK